MIYRDKATDKLNFDFGAFMLLSTIVEILAYAFFAAVIVIDYFMG